MRAVDTPPPSIQGFRNHLPPPHDKDNFCLLLLLLFFFLLLLLSFFWRWPGNFPALCVVCRDEGLWASSFQMQGGYLTNSMGLQFDYLSDNRGIRTMCVFWEGGGRAWDVLKTTSFFCRSLQKTQGKREGGPGRGTEPSLQFSLPCSPREDKIAFGGGGELGVDQSLKHSSK